MHANALPELLTLALVALAMGMRHGVDADHLAAIDAMTRCNAEARPALARRTGVWFSIGHGAVVISVALAVALGTRTLTMPAWLQPAGAWTSIAMLVLLGLMNLWAWRQADAGQRVAPVGWRSALFGNALRACSRNAVMAVGALFALSFDTLSQAALMAATGVASHGLPAVALLSVAFVAGMMITDGLNGWCVARLMQRPGLGAVRASRVMCAAVGAVSLGTAAVGAAAQLSTPAADWVQRHAGLLAITVVTTIVGGFVAGLMLARRPAPLTLA